VTRTFAVSLLLVLGATVSHNGQAQSGREVSVERDLRREQRIEQRLEENLGRPLNPNATPDNPDGMVGFDGSPNDGIQGVVTGGPLPPGSPSNPD
jgi:hypothetical protein